MRTVMHVQLILSVCAASVAAGEGVGPGAAVALPTGVRTTWDMARAFRETTSTRERICINGLWQWQPVRDGAGAAPPTGEWGYFKVPGSWPGITDYMQKDFQAVHAHPSWGAVNPAGIREAWYRREIRVPNDWNGRRILVQAETVNALAEIFLDGAPVGEIRYPGGELDITGGCVPGRTAMLALRVTAMPLQGVMLSYNDTNSAREVRGAVARRGLCGDVWLAGVPAGPTVDDVRVRTSVDEGMVTFDCAVRGAAPDAEYRLQATVTEKETVVARFSGPRFRGGDTTEGRIVFSAEWRPPKLWDIHTPGNRYGVEMTLLGTDGDVLDAGWVSEFGFREFRIRGRDFYLNGSRIYLSAVPLDNAQVGAWPASYAGARESLERLRSFGINFVYTHNYGCEPGAHLSFSEILRAADDVGMLVGLSQPHFSAYNWQGENPEGTNGYARHAAAYVRAAGNHPSVVAYATSHNATGYSDDMNPDLIDGVADVRDSWSRNNARLAMRAEAIIRRLDPSRIVYHHSSGNLGSMHTSNFYPNWAPIQELDDWFEHWATQGVKPVFLCEYGAPFGWDWALYRGWYDGKRNFGSAVVPWDYSMAEWNAQFLGASAFRISEREKRNIRWEADQFRRGRLWHRWDYPYAVGDRRMDEMEPVQSLYTVSNWRAYRTWGLSANSPWEHGRFWKLRDDVDRRRVELPTAWDDLQRPGLSPDFIDQQYERMDLAFKASDWTPTATGATLMRNNGPVLAYIAGKPGSFTEKGHNVLAGETLAKQAIVINNSRETVSCDCVWSINLPSPARGALRIEGLPTGEQKRMPVEVPLPANTPARRYVLEASFTFSTGETQRDAFDIDVLPAAAPVPRTARTALFDPAGVTARVLDGLGIDYSAVSPDADLSGVDLLIVGRHALTVDGPGPDLARVRAGMKVIVFEQEAEVLEKRLGFRVATYGLRQVFPRIPDHPVLSGLEARHLRDWRGTATLVPPRLESERSDRYAGAPVVRWCGLEVPRVWRAGCRGNVASVSIEKPEKGDFLPICDGGFSLQYSQLLEYREGRGMVLFCQLDVTGRTESDPAGERLVRNLLGYAAVWAPGPSRTAVYAGDARTRAGMQELGIAPEPYGRRVLQPDSDLLVLAGEAPGIAPDTLSAFVQAGGRILALGTNEAGAGAVFPFPIRMREDEYIAAHFEPLPAASPFAGISPADVHNRAPCRLPLVTGGATVVGNGVLAVEPNTGTVFCQLAPTRFREAGDLEKPPFRRTLRRNSFLVTRLLGNLGVRADTPLLHRFAASPETDGGETLLRNGNFGGDADGNGVPDEWSFSVDGGTGRCTIETGDTGLAGRFVRMTCTGIAEGGKGTTMLAQTGVPVVEGQWYRIALKARAANLGGEAVTVALQDTTRWSALLEYRTFRPGEAWQEFVFTVRATGTEPVATRFQIWHGAAGTLELADMRLTPCGPPSEGRWSEGLYVLRPTEWDDPYRFFRW